MADHPNDSMWASGGPGDRDLFKGDPARDIASDDLFTVPFEPPLPQPLGQAEPLPQSPADPLPLPPEWGEPKATRWFSMQSILVAAVMAVAFLLLYTLFLAPLPATTEGRPMPVDHRSPAATPEAHVDQAVQEPAPGPDPLVTEVPVMPDTHEAASRQVAETAFAKMDFEKAMAVYKRLYQGLPSRSDSEGVRDYLVWRMALCSRGQEQLDQAVVLLRQPANSRLPVIRALARYHLGLIDLERQQHLEAASEIYQALALIDGLRGQAAWTETFKRDCRFLIAKAVTLEALSLREPPEDGPAALWPQPSSPDLWAQLDDPTWRELIQSGSQAFAEASVSARVETVADGQGAGGLWRIISNGTPLEEVLARFCTQAKLDLRWSVSTTSGTITIDPAVRRRPLFVYLDGVTQRDVLAQVAGAARLWVGVEPSGVAVLIDPFGYRTLGEQIAALRQQAVSLWYQLRLVAPTQGIIPTTHFALGLLYEQNDQKTQALSEFSLLVSRFPQADLAPHALLRSSRLSVDLHDYAGARQVLSQLVEQYPEAASSSQALLALGEATLKAGLLDDAVRVYTKAFHTGMTAEARATAAFMAGQCLFQQQQYEQALRWLTRCLDLAAKTRTKGPEGVHLWIGKTYLAMAKFAQAADALDRAVEDAQDKTQYMETLSALITARIGQEDCVGALNALDREAPWALTRRDRTELSIFRARVLRTMGLAEKAVGLLEEGLGSAGDPNQRVHMYFEMACCHEVLGQWEPVRSDLAQVLMGTEPGPLAQEAGLKMALASLKMGQSDQAIDLCRQVLDASSDESIRRRAAGLLATAYEGQQEYGKAAESLVSLPGRRGRPVREVGPSQSPSKEVTRAEP